MDFLTDALGRVGAALKRPVLTLQRGDAQLEPGHRVGQHRGSRQAAGLGGGRALAQNTLRQPKRARGRGQIGVRPPNLEGLDEDGVSQPIGHWLFPPVEGNR